jgi:hypothetical protein
VKAREIIQGASFDAEKLKILFAAFDSVWAEVAGGVGADPQAIDAARGRLASIVLTLAEHGPVDLAGLRSAARQLFSNP